MAYDANDKVRQLRGLQGLNSLTVQDGEFGDEGMEYLAAIPNLRVFRYEGGAVTARGIGYLTRCARLEELVLDCGFLTSECGPALTQVPQLRRLRLCFRGGTTGNAESNAAGWVRHLKQLHKLKRLEVEGDWLMPSDVDELRCALPSTDITWSRGRSQKEQGTKPPLEDAGPGDRK
jgi:hypothetical protein